MQFERSVALHGGQIAAEDSDHRDLCSTLSRIFLATPACAGGITDAEVKKPLIDESISSCVGNGPRAFSRVRNGSRCGILGITASRAILNHCAMTVT